MRHEAEWSVIPLIRSSSPEGYYVLLQKAKRVDDDIIALLKRSNHSTAPLLTDGEPNFGKLLLWLYRSIESSRQVLRVAG